MVVEGKQGQSEDSQVVAAVRVMDKRHGANNLETRGGWYGQTYLSRFDKRTQTGRLIDKTGGLERNRSEDADWRTDGEDSFPLRRQKTRGRWLLMRCRTSGLGVAADSNRHWRWDVGQRSDAHVDKGMNAAIEERILGLPGGGGRERGMRL